MRTINTLNGDYNLREQIIFGEDYNKQNYFGGCRNFSCDRATLEKLLENNFIDPHECQNSGPYVEDFLAYTEGIDGVEYECYAISPERGDYRVTIEGIDLILPDTDYGNLSMIVESFHSADEFSFQHVGHTYLIHAWWD